MRTGTLEIAAGILLGLVLFVAAMIGAMAVKQLTHAEAATPLVSIETGANQ